MRRPRQRSAARISAAYISFKTARSPKACGITLVRRRSSPNSRSSSGGADHAAVAEGEAQMRDAGLEIILEAGHRAGQIATVGCPDIVAQQPRQSRRGGLVAGNGAGLELGPEVFRHLACQVAHLVRQTALPQRAREALFDRPDDAGAPSLTTNNGSGKPRRRMSRKNSLQ